MNLAPYIVTSRKTLTSETRSLSRATILGIIEDVSGLIDDVVQQIQIEVNSVLRNQHVYPSQIEGLDSAFTGKYAKPFEGLTTFYQQLQFFRVIWINCKYIILNCLITVASG